MKKEKAGYVYILTNMKNGTLYVGVTSDLARRIYEHKEKIFKGFTKKYGLNRLVYYEVYEDVVAAIEREKKLKKYKREYKINLIRQMNSEWDDLYETLA